MTPATVKIVEANRKERAALREALRDRTPVLIAGERWIVDTIEEPSNAAERKALRLTVRPATG